LLLKHCRLNIYLPVSLGMRAVCWACLRAKCPERLQQEAEVNSKSRDLCDKLSRRAAYADAAESSVPSFWSCDVARIGDDCRVPIRRQQPEENRAEVLPLPPSTPLETVQNFLASSPTDPQFKMKRHSVKKIADPARRRASADWQFLQKALQPCLSALRSQFDKATYNMFMEQQKYLNDMTVARTQAISSVVDDIVASLTGAMKSERAVNLIAEYELRIRRLLEQEVEEMFASIEEVSGSSHLAECFDSVDAEPESPPSAFFLFLSRTRTHWEAESGFTYLPDHWAQTKWKRMSAKHRKGYEMEVLKLKAIYEEQLTEYREHGHYKVPVRS